MKFFSNILRAVLLLCSLAVVVILGVAGYFGLFEVLWAPPAEQEAALQEFLQGSKSLRLGMAGVGMLLGILISALTLGPIALLYEIRDTMADIRDRLAAGRDFNE